MVVDGQRKLCNGRGSEPRPRPVVGRGTEPADVMTGPGTSNQRPLGGAVGAGSDHIMRTAWESDPLSPADAGALPIELYGCTIDIPLTRRTIACAQVSETACGGNGRQSYKRGVVFSWSKLNSICEYIKLLG